MPHTQPRLTAVVERPLFHLVEEAAHRDGVSLSQKVRDLLKHALELEEDLALEALVLERKQNPGKSIPLATVKKRLKLR